MIQRFISAFIMFGVSTACCFAAENVSCPESITTRQELTSAASGWAPLLNDAPHSLAGITFYDGPPAENASLAYDQIRHGNSEDLATWSFGKHEDRRIWLVCSYSGTAVELSRTLPVQIITCSVSYDPQTQIAGLPAIQKISCR